MVYLYPANRMEDLVAILSHVFALQPLPPLQEEVILVQSQGMQHWLNMSLAEQRQISMNLRFALPASYLWQLIRQLNDHQLDMDAAPYSREVLGWRIHHLLTQDCITQDSDCDAVTRYWRQAQGDDELKRFQLSGQLADAFEQYMIFRPDWINAWHFGQQPPELEQDSQAIWQGKIWRALTREQAYDPKALITHAIGNIKNHTQGLPKRISVFGINTLPPLWLELLQALGEHIDIHLYHLNPCCDYWGDIVSEKQHAKLLQKWADQTHDAELAAEVGNPLLANLGQQGREFVALLQQYEMTQIDVFDMPAPEQQRQQSVLHQIQQDILQLQDARLHPQQIQDNSIVISSAHSALREVQGLHDWLLHQFNQDPALTPKDVLVMCPQIEQYAPYIDAIFARGWDEFDENVPPLPCSIADRVSKDAEPLVAAFTDMLSLPDSRFQVNQLLSYLRLPSMQTKFGIDDADLELIALWLDKAAVHWGVDLAHKRKHVGAEVSTARFTWSQGLRRLMLGFAQADRTTLLGDDLTLPWVEGDNALLLGKLMQICEQLQDYAQRLNRPRSPQQWHALLSQMLDNLFSAQANEDAFNIINQAICALAEFCQDAGFEQSITLPVIVDFLTAHFSQPDPGRQFMIGQVTFCSMLPMRSIPFKIIAVLGLNDGEFPRQRQPQSFDLIDRHPPRRGDRSRRGDDRYLFLEALISVRDKLYLSFQGHDVKNNNLRQPSLVLTELMDYLQQGFGWQLAHGSDEPEKSAHIQQQSLQPFNLQNYAAASPLQSFDASWLKLIQQLTQQDNLKTLPADEDITTTLSLDQMVRFFQFPAREFAQQRLGLFFNQSTMTLDDAEPFSSSGLDKFQLKQQLLDIGLGNYDSQDMQMAAQAEAMQIAQLSGAFPDTPAGIQTMQEVASQVSDFEAHLISAGAHVIDMEQVEITLDGLNLQASLPWQQSEQSSQLLHYRCGQMTNKDKVSFWLHHLLAHVLKQSPVTSVGHYLGADKQGQATIRTFTAQPVDDAADELSHWIRAWQQGQQQALLLNADIAEALHNKGQACADNKLESLWHDVNSFQPPIEDPYFQFFWPECPPQPPVQQACGALYANMFNAIREEKA